MHESCLVHLSHPCIDDGKAGFPFAPSLEVFSVIGPFEFVEFGVKGPFEYMGKEIGDCGEKISPIERADEIVVGDRSMDLAR